MRRHGRRAAARRDAQRRSGAHRRRRRVAPRAPRRARLPRRVHDRPRRGGRPRRRGEGRGRGALSVGVVGNAAEVFRELLLRGDRRSTSSPTRRAPTTRSPTCRSASTFEDWKAEAERDPEGFTARARGSMAKQVAAMVGFQDAGAAVFDYGNSIRARGAARRLRAGVRVPRVRAGLHPPAVRRGHADRSAGWRSRATPRTSARPTRPSRSSSPRTPGCVRWLDKAGETVHFEGLPARICWLGYKERHLAGLKFNEMVASGELSAPIVIGRDHLDAGLGRLALPRDRGDGRRLGRDRRLAAAERAAQHRERRLVGVDPPRRRRRHRPQHPCRAGDRRRRHARSPPRSSSACSRTTPAPASCATSTPATTARRRSRASAA